MSSQRQPASILEPRRTFDVERVRKDFPVLGTFVNKHPLVYLDNAATSQKPQSVINALSDFYEEYNSNIHRGVHYLSQKATDAYELARIKTQEYIGAERPEEIIFTRGTTEAVNLVAQTFGKKQVGKGDEILVTALEHHSNIVPWQMLCEDRGASLKVVPMTDDGELDLDAFEHLLNPKTRLLAMTHVSNALGTVNPVKAMIAAAHQSGIPVLIDGAQAIPHLDVNVKDLGCDFYAFSGHKMFGPTGIGVLYGRKQLLERMPPYQGGGDMIKSVSFEKTTYAELPNKFEAGTPNISGGIAFGAAIDYLNAMDRNSAHEHESSLLEYATTQLASIRGLQIIGKAREKVGVLSFVLENVHPHDIGTILDSEGIAIRTGHHCAQPIMTRLGIPATARASFAFYNTFEEVDMLVGGIYRVIEVFGR
ncbi:MAG TPA: cysteine desulfurase [Bacteroidota bacterium]